jgi:Tannase and feruloyl esterase
MAQRFPDDYDGIVSIVPVINWVALQSAGNRTGIVQQNGGWLDAAKLALVRKAVIAACDADDGLADGVISRYEDCAKKFDAKTLRCRTARMRTRAFPTRRLRRSSRCTRRTNFRSRSPTASRPIRATTGATRTSPTACWRG